MTPQALLPSTIDPDLLAAGFAPAPKTVRGSEKLKGVRPELLDHWSNLQNEFEQAGVQPEIKSGFRTAEQQNYLHTHGYPTKGNDGYVNLSPHQDRDGNGGSALDISFPANQKAKGRQIIADYARRTGLHVPSDEPWHIALSPESSRQTSSQLDPDLLQAGFGDSAQTSPDIDPDLLAAGYREHPRTLPAPRRDPFAGVQAGAGAQRPATGLGEVPGSPLAEVFKKPQPQLPVNPRTQFTRRFNARPPTIHENLAQAVENTSDPERDRIRQEVIAEREARQQGPMTQARSALALRDTAQPSTAVEDEVTRRYSALQQQRAVNEHIMSQFTDADKAEISDFANHLKNAGQKHPIYAGVRTGARSIGSGVAYKIAGALDVLGGRENDVLGNWLRRKALAGEISVEDVKKELPPSTQREIADFLTQSALGLAEVVATPGGPVAKFAGLAGTEALGRGRSLPEVALETGKGAAIGELFKGAGRYAPAEGATRGTQLMGAAKQAGAVGTGTAGIELATGATPTQAGVAGLTNAVYAGGPAALGAIRGRGVQIPHERVGELIESPLTSDAVQKQIHTLLHDGQAVIHGPDGRVLHLRVNEDNQVIATEAPRERVPINDYNNVVSALGVKTTLPEKPVVEKPAEPAKRPEDYLPSFFGVKPAEPSAEVQKETAPAQPGGEELTSVRRVDVNEDRRALGQPEFTPPEKKTWQATYDIAEQRGYVKDARAIAEGVLKKEGATLSDEQVAGINLRLAELKNEHKAALAEGNGDKVDSIENDFNLLQNAADKAGSETARALNIRKATLNSDYELITLLQRAKAKGIEVTPDKRTEYRELSARIADLESQLDRAHLAPVQARLDQIGRVKVRAEARAKLDVEYESLKRELATEFRVKTQPAGLAGIDPEGKRTILLTRIVRNRVKAGYTDAVGLLDEVHSVVKGYGLSRQEIKDIIAAELETSPANRRRQTQLFKQEADLTRRLAEKDFSKPERKPVVYNRETVRLQGAIDKLKTQYETELHNAELTKKQKWAQYFFDVAMIPKSVMSSADLSASLRQGGFHSFTHPIISAKAFARSLAGISDVGHAKLRARIESHPDYNRAVRAGVEFTGLDNPNVREEHYISNLAAKAPVLKHSERAFTGFLDTQRLQVFSKLSEGVKDYKSLSAIGEMINIASGRADVRPGGPLAKSMYAANLAFYSPRLVASRLQLLNKMLNPASMANMPKEVRGRLVADNIKFVGVVATTMALAKASGATVSLDPDSPDFLKLKYGNTRYDVLLGLQQPLRLLINSGRAMYNYANGAPSKKSAGELIGRFGRSKLSPEASYLVDWVNEKDYLGEPFAHSSALANRLSPLVFQDMYDAMKDQGFLFSEPLDTAGKGTKGLLKASPAFFGIGLSTYDERKRQKFRSNRRF